MRLRTGTAQQLLLVLLVLALRMLLLLRQRTPVGRLWPP
jgi:hypothetical protein